MSSMFLNESVESEYEQHVQTMPLSFEDEILRDVEYLNKIRVQAARLQEIKERLEEKLKNSLKHEKEGAATYKMGLYKITITTNKNYSVNREEYDMCRAIINKSVNPVQEKTTYSVTASDYNRSVSYCSDDELEMIARFVRISDAKLNVKIQAND